MRILLTSPAQVHSVNSFSEASEIIGSVGLVPNLALPTLAALTPDDFEVVLADESLAPIDFDTPWDFVGITGYVNHAERMFEIAARFRERGVRVGIGGPFASLSPERVRPHADVLFIGEAEEIWPAFLRDLRDGAVRPEYRERGVLDVNAYEPPDFRGLLNDGYWFGIVQTSRGCPFQCEFCDAIIFLGRKQRYKTPARIVDELAHLRDVGYRNVLLADDNLTANRRTCEAILRHVGDWNRGLPEPLFLATQISIDVARSPELLDLCAWAGLRYVFIGIETPNVSSLREARKKQNVAADLVRDVRVLHERGVGVHAGMIVGFDSDGPETFRSQYEYLQRVGVPLASVSILNAPDGTPLKRRLERAGRLREGLMGDKHLVSNVVPMRMTDAELQLGMIWLVNRLYDPVAFAARLEEMAAGLPEEDPPARQTQEVAELWERLVKSFDTLGPEFGGLPALGERLFRRKGMATLRLMLVLYKHLVSLFRLWGVWQPQLARLEAPPFAPRTPEERARLAELETRTRAAAGAAS